MPSDKRARQRAMRAQKQAIIQQQRRRKRTTRRAIYATVFVVIFVGLAFLIFGSGSNGKKPAASGSSTTTTTSTPTTSVTTTTAKFKAPTTLPLTTKAVVPTCAPAGNKTRVVWFTKAPPDCISKNSVWDATFVTSAGSFVVQMDASKSYAAVNNFVFLAQWNYFNGTEFHRVLPGFAAQGGDPTATGSGGPHQFPGYSYTGNVPSKDCAKDNSGPTCYQPYDLVMANSNGPNTNGSQFFFVLPGGQTQLDSEPNYTDFGKTISGSSVVDQIGKWGNSNPSSNGVPPDVIVYITSLSVKEVTPAKAKS